MRICHGLAGLTLEVEDRELEWRRLADVVRHHAGEHWRVAADDLIALASGGGTLKADCGPEALSHGQDVFVFARSDLDPEADVPSDRLLLDPGNFICRASSSQAEPAPEDEGLPRDPAFEAFRANLAEARRRLAEARPAAGLAAHARARLEVQRLAAQAVLDNLMSQRATCSRSLALFFQKCERVQEKFDQNLGRVEAAMAALTGVALHPALQGAGRACLADAVPRERILRFTASASAERARLARRLEKLQRQDAQVQALSEQVAEGLRDVLAGEAVPTAALAIDRELERIEFELLPALRDQVPSEGAAPSSVLEEEKRSSGMLEGLAQACGALGGLLLADLRDAWERQCTGYLQRLREVSYIQSQVRDVERQAALLEEEVNAQRGYSQQLSHLQKMPKAYRRALCEIARRQQFRARYLAQAEQARSSLARMVEEENSHRRDFVHRYGCHLPADLFEPLGSLALPASVEVPDFDGALPDVDFTSLRGYATVVATGAPGASAASSVGSGGTSGQAGAAGAVVPGASATSSAGSAGTSGHAGTAAAGAPGASAASSAGSAGTSGHAGTATAGAPGASAASSAGSAGTSGRAGAAAVGAPGASAASSVGSAGTSGHAGAAAVGAPGASATSSGGSEGILGQAGTAAAGAPGASVVSSGISE